MEFLMTYGWAILVVLAAIGALAYFGVLSPDRFLPDKCTISPPISCLEYKASSVSGNITFNLQQDSGNQLNITSVNVTPGCNVFNNGSGSSWTVINNNEKTGPFTASCSGLTGKSGQKFKGTIAVTYIPTDGVIARSVSGTIQTKIE